MKRRKPAQKEPVVAHEILEEAKRTLASDLAKPKVQKCVVCGEPVAPNSTENLCWVCRRLKISAWGESDYQMPASE